MEIIYPTGGTDASNIQITAQKRLLRVIQGQTQATPTSGYLDPSLRTETGGIRIPLSTDKAGVKATGAAAASPFEREVTAFSFENGLVPGTLLVKTSGENYAVADGKKNEGVIAGLLGQWVGGTFDGVHNQSNISVWQGPDSYYDLLAPGFGTIEEVATKSEKGEPSYLFAGGDGRLTTTESKSKQKVAEVIEFNPSVLRFRLLI
jgi:hypothetical protein